MVNLFFFILYITFILQWIAFVFGRDEEQDQSVFCVQETTLSFFVMYLSPLMSEVYLFSVICYLYILQWIAFIFGRDEEEDQKGCRLQERQLSLSLLCTYLA